MNGSRSSRSDAFTATEIERIRSAAGELEQYARGTHLAPSEDLAARIAAAIEQEPAPAPLTAMAQAAREHRAAGFVAGLRDLWRVTWSGGRPAAIRLSAALVVLLLVAGVGSATGLAAVGAWNVLSPNATTTPAPSVREVPVVVPPVQPSVPAEPLVTPPPVETPAPTASPTPRPTARPTPRPTARPTPRPTRTPMPARTHHPDATHQAEPTHWPGHG
jgi:hypothetical protein